MSTLKTTNLQHPSAASPAIVLDADGDATYSGVHDFSAATVTGAGGLRLVTPTSIANSGGSASASGGAVTFTGVTSLSLNGVFSSGYDNYRIIIRSVYSTGTNGFMRLRAAGTDNTTASSYVVQELTASSTSVNGSRITADNWRSWSGAVTITNGVAFDIYSPFLATSTALTSSEINSSSGAYLANYAGTHNQTTSYDGATFYVTSGNITGIIRVYGYQNS